MTTDAILLELQAIARREGLTPDALERQVLAQFVATYRTWGAGLPLWACPLPAYTGRPH